MKLKLKQIRNLRWPLVSWPTIISLLVRTPTKSRIGRYKPRE